ncbi:melanopsin-B-like [Bolinopsis microptera]|uniref:melanopsin-B-like n=1 Tax=Bolinopsis microptera TaxID=2820187 RepID=UPI00307A2F0D
MWTLAASSVDRYILICHSGRYRDIISKSRVKALLVLIWMVAMVAAVPPLLGWSRFGYSDSSFNCGIVPDADWTPHKCTTLASNSTIIMQNHIASKELSNGVSNNSKEKPSMQLVGRRASAMIATPNRKSQKRMWMMLRVTISIFLIVTASVVSVMPILIIGILGWSGVSLSISDRMHQVVHWIFVGNSAINPIVFGLMNPLIRSSIYNILKNATPRDLERVS